MLLVFRVFQGIGFGGEWAVGAILVAELIKPEARGKALGVIQSAWAVGWALAVVAYTIVFSLVSDEQGWRILMMLGILPALLILYVRRNVDDPEVFSETKEKEKRRDREAVEANATETPLKQIFRSDLAKTTIFASILATGIQGGYYAMFTWIPTYLKEERSLSVVGSAGYLFVVIAGAFLGYLSAGFVHDRLGRKKTLHAVRRAGRGLARRLLPRAERLEHDAADHRLPARLLRLGLLLGLRLLPGRAVSRRGRAGPARASVTTSAARSGRCSRASSASSRRPSASAAPSRSASSATCSRSSRCASCPRPTAKSSSRSSDRAQRRAGGRPRLRPRAAAPRRCAGVAGARAGRAAQAPPPPRAGAGGGAHERLGPARDGRALRHAHRRVLPPGREPGAARRRRGRRAGPDRPRASRSSAPTRSRRCSRAGCCSTAPTPATRSAPRTSSARRRASRSTPAT